MWKLGAESGVAREVKGAQFFPTINAQCPDINENKLEFSESSIGAVGYGTKQNCSEFHQFTKQNCGEIEEKKSFETNHRQPF